MIKLIIRLLNFSGDNKKNIMTSFASGFVCSLFEVLPVLAILTVLTGIIEKNMSAIHIIVAFSIMVISLAGQIIFNTIACTNRVIASFKMCSQKRLEVGVQMKRVPMGYFSKNRLGEITATLTTTLSDVENTAVIIFQKIINGFIHAIVVTIWLLIFEWRLGIISILGLIVASIVFALIQKQSKVLSPRRQKAQAGLVITTLEYLHGMGVIKAFSLGDKNKGAVAQAIDESCRANSKLEAVFTSLSGIYQSIFKLFFFVILIVSTYLLTGGQIDTTKCLMLMVATFILYASVEVMGSISSLSRVIEYSLDKMDALADTPLLDENGTDIIPKNYNIEMKNVCFSYDNREVLHNINLFIPEKTITAIVGPSGSGKSTLCNLIARFWDVQKGEVMIGGCNIKEYTYESLMTNISMVFQNVYLFEDTIANNIKFGKPEATKEEMIEISKKSCCHDFISALPDGYDTVIGEGGATLSGGEKQRISIARAMLKDAPIIILDEATASVDPENEYFLHQAIEELTKNKTIILIAHRLKTVRNADSIIVLEDGKITQQGTHSELMKREGAYRRFVGLRKQAVSWRL